MEAIFLGWDFSPSCAQAKQRKKLHDGLQLANEDFNVQGFPLMQSFHSSHQSSFIQDITIIMLLLRAMMMYI